LEEKIAKLEAEIKSPSEKTIEKEVDILKRKTAEDFYEEVAEIKLKNIELIGKIE